jgi:hypothetical protein
MVAAAPVRIFSVCRYNLSRRIINSHRYSSIISLSIYMKKIELWDILKDQLPSSLFRRLIDADPAIGNVRLGEALSDEFVDLSGESQQLV